VGVELRLGEQKVEALLLPLRLEELLLAARGIEGVAVGAPLGVCNLALQAAPERRRVAHEATQTRCAAARQPHRTHHAPAHL
jgi:hypothetical protein